MQTHDRRRFHCKTQYLVANSKHKHEVHIQWKRKIKTTHNSDTNQKGIRHLHPPNSTKNGSVLGGFIRCSASALIGSVRRPCIHDPWHSGHRICWILGGGEAQLNTKGASSFKQRYRIKHIGQNNGPHRDQFCIAKYKVLESLEAFRLGETHTRDQNHCILQAIQYITGGRQSSPGRIWTPKKEKNWWPNPESKIDRFRSRLNSDPKQASFNQNNPQ